MKTNWPVIRRAGFLAIGLTLCASPLGAQTAPPSRAAQEIPVRAASSAAPTSTITRLEVGRTGQQTIVRIEGNRPLSYQAEHLQNPERLVLDFSGTRFAANWDPHSAAARPVQRVRAGQYKPDAARVVIDLTGAVPYDVSAAGTWVQVTFAATSDPAPVARTSVAQVTRPANRSAELPRTPQKREDLVADISGMPLPETLTRRSAGLASLKPQGPPPAPATPPQEPAAPAPQPVAQPQVVKGAATSASGQKFTGEPISVNFKDLDLKDFFRLIHEISGLNVVLDPAVRGSLPALVLDEVPWDQALDIVLKNNGLDKELDGNVLRIATKETLKKEVEMQRDLIKAQQEAVEPVTATRVLSYTKASALVTTLRRWLSARGEIVADERTNTLIIKDIPSVLPDIDNLIRQLDRKSQQVEIEARVVAASRSFARDIGSQFAFSAQGLNGRNVFGGNTTVGTSQGIRTNPPFPPLVVGGSSSSGGQMPLNTNLAAGSPTSGVSFFHSSPNFALDYMITAAESKGVGKLLSKPKVYTQNNQKGTVKQGNRVPIQTTINNTISVQYVDAVLKLEVTPQITADGTIFMQVSIENTQIDNGIPRVQGIPALDTQSVETSVLINDGGTVVIGGIMVSSQRTDINQVPLFGSVPVIGHLFKRTSVNVTSQELYFFLTPRVIPN
jgi:type IV pilus secretin PilQ/predicted competence protein